MPDEFQSRNHFSRYLKDYIYGAIDGAVTTFAVVSGVAGAKLPDRIVIILGIANLVADGFSMAVSNYLGSRAEDQARVHEGLQANAKSPLKAGLVTFIAFFIVGAIPLLSYVANYIFPTLALDAFFWSCVLTGVTFFLVGTAKSRFTRQPWTIAGLETLAIGGAAAVIAYGIGAWLKGVV